ncbi:MAG: Fe-S-containing hydro-lyase [Nitrospirae bacterium]|nr:Fe-S-containing hydro-lyase [Nitrospirota bacterium]
MPKLIKKEIRITTPLADKVIKSLKTGDKVLISGIIYTARDVAHKRLVDAIKDKEKLPFNLKGQIIYFTGPTPAPPDKVIGSAGPTTSSRMDSFSPALIKKGLKGMIGKGPRGKEVVDAMKKYKAVYFAAVGGAAALLSKRIKKSEVIAYEDLGTEAIRRLEVEDFPVIVVNDIYGDDLYLKGMKRYAM